MSSVSSNTFHIGKAKDEDGRVYEGIVLCVDRLSGVAIVEPILFEGLRGDKIGQVPVRQWLSSFEFPNEITTEHDQKSTTAWFNSLCPGSGVSATYFRVYRSQTNSQAEVEGEVKLLQILCRIHLEKAPHGINWLQCIWAVLQPLHQTTGHPGLSSEKIMFRCEK